MTNPGQIDANSSAAVELHALAESFERHLRAANLSPMTVKTYIDAVAQLSHYLVATATSRLSGRSRAPTSRASHRRWARPAAPTQRLWRTRAEVRRVVFDYIAALCNPHRRHSALGNLSPAEFERRYPATSLAV